MKKILRLYKEIFKNDRGLFWWLVWLFLMGVIFWLMGVVNLKPSGSAVKIAYSDLSGYKDGNWKEMLVFPLMAGVLAILHNFLAVRIYEKKGRTLAKVFVIVSILINILGVTIFVRLLEWK